jgi:hypothetical protein
LGRGSNFWLQSRGHVGKAMAATPAPGQTKGILARFDRHWATKKGRRNPAARILMLIDGVYSVFSSPTNDSSGENFEVRLINCFANLSESPSHCGVQT